MTIQACYPSIAPLFSAEELEQQWQNVLKPFWQTMQSGQLLSADNVQLRYYFHQTPNAHSAVVISSGRVEMAVKYAEVCYELVQAGYSVFLLDHRGQGLSQRELSNPHKGYVADFSNYQQDFDLFMQRIVQPSAHASYIALGHSMGCAILAGYLQQFKHPFDAAIFCSPMLGIYTGLVPARVAESLALGYATLNRRLSNTPWYFPGQSDFAEKAFDNNPLTSCPQRLDWLYQLYREHPTNRLGGVTSSWIAAAIATMRQLQRNASYWSLPTLLLQAGADKVVSNYAQNLWYQQLPSALLKQKHLIAGARHEILMEQDAIRLEAYNSINHFLQQLSATA